VAGVTAGKVRPELRVVGGATRVGRQAIERGPTSAVAARWGISGKGGIHHAGQGPPQPSGRSLPKKQPRSARLP